MGLSGRRAATKANNKMQGPEPRHGGRCSTVCVEGAPILPNRMSCASLIGCGSKIHRESRATLACDLGNNRNGRSHSAGDWLLIIVLGVDGNNNNKKNESGTGLIITV